MKPQEMKIEPTPIDLLLNPPDVTEAEGALISAYALGLHRRDVSQRPARDPLIDDVMYTRCDWLRPGAPSVKAAAHQAYQAALKAWREKRTA